MAAWRAEVARRRTDPLRKLPRMPGLDHVNDGLIAALDRFLPPRRESGSRSKGKPANGE